MSKVRHVLVVGPAGSGKTTFVLHERNPGDLILDFDLLFQAVTGDAIFERNAALKDYVFNLFRAAIALPHDGANRVWIVTTSWRIASDVMRRYLSDVVVLATPLDECRRRINRDTRRKSKSGDEALAIDWWKKIGVPSISERVVLEKLGGGAPASIAIQVPK